MPRPDRLCPQCSAVVHRVIHTVGEQPYALPCGHAIAYRYESDGLVSLRTPERGAGLLLSTPPVMPVG